MADKPIMLDDDESARLMRVFDDEIGVSEGAIGEQRAEMVRWRTYYHERDDTPAMFVGASTIRVPTVKTATQSLMAEITNALFSPDPIIHCRDIGWNSRMADEWERFYQELHMRYTRYIQTGKQFVYNGLRDGGALMMTYWKTEERRGWGFGQDTQQVVDPQTLQVLGEQTTRTPKQFMQTVYDAPAYAIIPLDRFRMLPAQAADIQQSDGIAVDWWLSTDELVQRMRQGVYAKKAVLKMLENFANGDYVPLAEEEQSGVAGTQASSTDTKERQRLIKIVDVYRFYRPKGGDTSLSEQWIFTYDPEKAVMLQARPLGLWHGLRPFVLARPYSVGEGIFGECVASAGGGAGQDALTSLLRLSVNCLIRGINPRIMVPKTLYSEMEDKLGPKARTVFTRDGAVIPMPDAFFENGKTVVPLMPGYNPQIVLPMLEYLQNVVNRGMGANDNMAGEASNAGITATEAQQVYGSQRKIAGMLTESFAEALSEGATQEHELMRQFYGRDSMYELWDDVNRQSGISLDDAMQAKLYFSANGAKFANNEMIQAKRAMELNAYLAEEPNTQMDPKLRYRLREYTIQRLGYQTPEDFLGTPEQFIQKDMARMQMQAMTEMNQEMNAAQDADMQAAMPPQAPGGG